MLSLSARSWFASLVPVLALAVLAGCGEDDAQTPAACLIPTRGYLEAVKEAPDPVRLEGSTPISECLPSGQPPAQLGQVGEALVGAATRLNAEARRDVGGDATVELGYLVGAAQEGASADVHTDLLRRLDAAARFNEGKRPLPARFERAFGEGYAAGQDDG